MRAPESRLPDEDLFLDRAQHDQDQPGSRQLRQHAERHAQRARHLGDSEKQRKAFACADALSATRRIFGVAPAAVEESDADHQAHGQQHNVGKNWRQREHQAFPCVVFAASSRTLNTGLNRKSWNSPFSPLSRSSVAICAQCRISWIRMWTTALRGVTVMEYAPILISSGTSQSCAGNSASSFSRSARLCSPKRNNAATLLAGITLVSVTSRPIRRST